MPWDSDLSGIFDTSALYTRIFSPLPATSGGLASQLLPCLLEVRGDGSSLLVLLTGPPASGKTSLARSVAAEATGRVVITRDLAGATGALREGAIVLVNQCNLKRKAREPYIAAARASGARVVVVLMDLPTDILVSRLMKRNAALTAEEGGGGMDVEEDVEGTEVDIIASDASDSEGLGGGSDSESDSGSDSGSEGDGGSVGSDESECSYVPPEAQASLMRRSEGIVGEEKDSVSRAFVVSLDAVGSLALFEPRTGGILALSGSTFGRNTLSNAKATLRAREGILPTPLNWETWGATSSRTYDLGRSPLPSELDALSAATGITATPVDAQGGERLYAALKLTVFDAAATRLVAQQPAVREALRLGGMTSVLEFLDELKEKGLLLGLFVPLYMLGAVSKIHRDEFDELLEASRLSVKATSSTTSESSLLILDGSGKVADVRFTGPSAYCGDKETCLANPHAVKASLTDVNFSLILDVAGNAKVAAEVMAGFKSALMADGARGGEVKASAGDSSYRPILSGVGAKSFSHDQCSKGGELTARGGVGGGKRGRGDSVLEGRSRHCMQDVRCTHRGQIFTPPPTASPHPPPPLCPPIPTPSLFLRVHRISHLAARRGGGCEARALSQRHCPRGERAGGQPHCARREAGRAHAGLHLQEAVPGRLQVLRGAARPGAGRGPLGGDARGGGERGGPLLGPEPGWCVWGQGACGVGARGGARAGRRQRRGVITGLARAVGRWRRWRRQRRRRAARAVAGAGRALSHSIPPPLSPPSCTPSIHTQGPTRRWTSARRRRARLA
jgi:broad-specificity NMP kinase